MERQLSDWINAYLDYTSNSEPKESYREWMAISAIAAALRRKCYLPWGMETFYPNLFVILVGPPAARKGTAMKPMMELIDAVGIKRAANETSRQKLIKKLIESQEVDIDENKIIRTHSSLTIFSSELTVFLKYDNKELLTVLCNLFDCESKFQYDTIQRGEETVTNVWLSLIGATTPELLQTSLPKDAFGSGFISRTIFVYEESKGQISIYPGLTTEQLKIKQSLLHDLEIIKSLEGPFTMEPAAMDSYSEWRIDAENNPPFEDSRLSGYCERRPLHFFKLCMICSASRSNTKIISLDDTIRAAEILQRVEKKMPQVFQGIGRNPLADVQIRIMKTIMEKGSISAGTLLSMYSHDVSQKQLWEVLASLEQMRFCSFDYTNKMIIKK